jgi:hypothetical protein
MTSLEFTHLLASRKASGLLTTHAVVRDWTRRGGVRVAKVRVTSDLAPMQAACVEEIRTNIPHVLPYKRLCKQPGPVLKRVVRRNIELPAPDEKSAITQTTAGAGAV